MRKLSLLLNSFLILYLGYLMNFYGIFNHGETKEVDDLYTGIEVYLHAYHNERAVLIPIRLSQFVIESIYLKNRASYSMMAGALVVAFNDSNDVFGKNKNQSNLIAKRRFFDSKLETAVRSGFLIDSNVSTFPRYTLLEAAIGTHDCDAVKIILNHGANPDSLLDKGGNAHYQYKTSRQFLDYLNSKSLAGTKNEEKASKLECISKLIGKPA